jgi:hypothetical protein
MRIVGCANEYGGHAEERKNLAQKIQRLTALKIAHINKPGLYADGGGLYRSPYRAGRLVHWVKVKNPKVPAVKREAEED